MRKPLLLERFQQVTEIIAKVRKSPSTRYSRRQRASSAHRNATKSHVWGGGRDTHLRKASYFLATPGHATLQTLPSLPQTSSLTFHTAGKKSYKTRKRTDTTAQLHVTAPFARPRPSVCELRPFSSREYSNSHCNGTVDRAPRHAISRSWTQVAPGTKAPQDMHAIRPEH